MSISGFRAKRIRPGVSKPRVVAKIRRSKSAAYTLSWDDISQLMIRRANCKCQECGATHRRLEVHHIIPVSKGGRTVEFNLRVICDRCHEKKPGHSHLTSRRLKR